MFPRPPHNRQQHAVVLDGNRIALKVKPMSVNAVDTHVQDYAGNKIRPQLRDAEAYYRQKMPTVLFGIFDGPMQRMIVYGYNPRVAHKGPNNVISAENHYLRTRASGAKFHVSFFDRCAGQSNNIACMKYHDFITNPEYGHQLFEQWDAKALFSGHSYNAVDRGAGGLSGAYKNAGKPNVLLDSEWLGLACESSRSNPWEVYDMRQPAHRRWVRHKGAGALGMLDHIYRPNPPTGGWQGRCGGETVKVLLSEFRWANFAAGIDDDNKYKTHHGIVWLRRGLTERAFQHGSVEYEPWTKLDLRRYLHCPGGWRPITSADLEGKCLDIVDPQYDLYDGTPLPQKPKKDHGSHMLARFGGCYCARLRGKDDGYICRPQRSQPIETCTALCNEWLFPDVADATQARNLEKETREDRGEVMNVDSDETDSDDEMGIAMFQQVLRERNAQPLGEHAKAALANASVREVASVAAEFGKAGRSESESEDSN